MTITPSTLAEWRALAEAATAGPWTISSGATMSGETEFWITETSDRFEPDAAFIAAARTAVPALLDEVARLTEERRVLVEALRLAWDATEGDAMTDGGAMARECGARPLNGDGSVWCTRHALHLGPHSAIQGGAHFSWYRIKPGTSARAADRRRATVSRIMRGERP